MHDCTINDILCYVQPGGVNYFLDVVWSIDFSLE